MATAAELLKVAAKEIGVREGRDSNGNWNNRVKYNDWYANHPSIKNPVFRTTAWCAVFVSWVANQVGMLGTAIPMHAWTPSGLSWFRTRGLVTQGKGAKAGDVFYIYYPSKGRVAHVGFVERVDGNYIYTIEGNTNTSGSSQGNGVYRLKRKITSNLYFCHPNYKSSGSASSGVGSKPKVSLADLHVAIEKDPPKKDQSTTSWADVYPIEAALANEGLLAASRVDGHWGTATIEAYTRWQRRLGYKGRYADGVPPKTATGSLKKLADKYGFQLVK